MASMELAPDDVVETHEEGAANDRVPLLVLSTLRSFLDEAGIGVDDLVIRRPTLDDVFLTLTGHAAEPTTESETPEEVPA